MTIGHVPITSVMTRSTVTARPDATIPAIVELMTKHHVGCVPIVDHENRPTGIVTKLDLIECPAGAKACDVMMPIAMTLGPDATLSRAAQLMASEGFHHVLVVDAERTLLGVVSTFDITRWVAQQ